MYRKQLIKRKPRVCPCCCAQVDPIPGPLTPKPAGCFCRVLPWLFALPRRAASSAGSKATSCWRSQASCPITFVCYGAFIACAFLRAPLLEFLLALYFLRADAVQAERQVAGLVFFATIVFAVDFYLILNGAAKLLKQDNSADETTAIKAREENSDSHSD
uniref:CKLF like MARVEL transmembrane domain containing 3 n=1 Tax=Equus asinus TaxID=9793 RepID=A0A8C4LHT5_EQUAS